MVNYRNFLTHYNNNYFKMLKLKIKRQINFKYSFVDKLNKLYKFILLN